MDFQHLPNVHTGRHAQRVQHNIQGPPIRKERHILHWQHTGNHTLIPMTACHLIPNRNLTLLGNVNAYCLVDPRGQLIPIFPGKYLSIHNNPILSMRHFQRSIPYLPGFFTENRPKEPLFCSKFRLTLWSYLAD